MKRWVQNKRQIVIVPFKPRRSSGLGFVVFVDVNECKQ